MTLLDELVRHLYVDLGQSTGGPLHIVLDDGNVDDQWIAEDESRYAFLFDGRFEDYAQPGEDVSEGHRREIRETCELILAELRRMSYTERTAAVRQAYNCATSHTHWRWMVPTAAADGYCSPFYQPTARHAYAAGFATEGRFVVAVSRDDTTWFTLTRPQFDRLADRLDTVQTLDEIGRLMDAEQWSEADLFGDLIAQREAKR